MSVVRRFTDRRPPTLSPPSPPPSRLRAHTMTIPTPFSRTFNFHGFLAIHRCLCCMGEGCGAAFGPYKVLKLEVATWHSRLLTTRAAHRWRWLLQRSAFPHHISASLCKPPVQIFMFIFFLLIFSLRVVLTVGTSTPPSLLSLRQVYEGAERGTHPPVLQCHDRCIGKLEREETKVTGDLSNLKP